LKTSETSHTYSATGTRNLPLPARNISSDASKAQFILVVRVVNHTTQTPNMKYITTRIVKPALGDWEEILLPPPKQSSAQSRYVLAPSDCRMSFCVQRPTSGQLTTVHATAPIPVFFFLTPWHVTTVKSGNNRENTANVASGGVRQLYQQTDFPLKHEPKIEHFHSHMPFYSSSKRSFPVRRDMDKEILSHRQRPQTLVRSRQTNMLIVQTAWAYFILAYCAGFVLGTFRFLALEPAIGPLAAVAVETPFIVAFCWIAWAAVRRRCDSSFKPMARLTIGILWLAFLLTAEVVLRMVARGFTLETILASFGNPEGQLGLAAQILCASFPLMQS
jgi:hypothetical protein